MIQVNHFFRQSYIFDAAHNVRMHVQLNVQIADLSIWEWFVRCLRLSVGLLLVSVAMSIPVVLFYGALMAKLLAK